MPIRTTTTRRIGRAALAFALLLSLAGCHLLGDPDEPQDDGLVRAVAKAPVAPDGDVAGRITDLVLHLDFSDDPGVPGLALRTGDEIRVVLPEAFRKTSDLPLLDIFACLGRGLDCDTAVLLVGWPQGALGAPPPLGYEVRYEGTHTVVFRATADHPATPGLKQIHLLLNSFANPRPGIYPIEVAATTSAGRRHGVGWARILARPRPSIEVTNALHEGFANGNYQTTPPGALVALPFDFLLWSRDGRPLEEVVVEGGRLVQRGRTVGRSRTVGRVVIEAPAGARGHRVYTEAPSAEIAAPVTGIPAGHLRAHFQAGSAVGDYTVAFSLHGGNTVTQIVRVR